MRGFSKTATMLIVLLAIVGMTTFAVLIYAEEDKGVGESAVVRVDFQIRIPKTLFLRMGSEGGTVDTVVFENAEFDGGQKEINGTYAPEILVGAMVDSVAATTLTADSSLGLVGASSGEKIPFSIIRSSGSGDFNSISGLPFDGTTSQIIWQTVGGGYKSGRISYTMVTNYDYPPDTYSGEVTYTLSSP